MCLLDLRAAVPSQQEITLTIWSVAARIVVTVPPRWRVIDQVLVVGARQTMATATAAPGSRCCGCAAPASAERSA